MTLILGIKCSDGIVMASDKAHTDGMIRVAGSKLYAVGNSLIAGYTGHGGIADKIHAAIAGFVRGIPSEEKPLFNRDPYEVLRFLHGEILKVYDPELRRAKQMMEYRIIDPYYGRAAESAKTEALIALAIQNQPYLMMEEGTGVASFIKEEMFFQVAGTGRDIGHTFLAFLNRVYWPDRKPILSEAVAAAVWTVQHTIKIHPGGVADGVQVIVLENDASGELKARELLDEEIARLSDEIDKAEEAIRELRNPL